jgi:hypothetical protein
MQHGELTAERVPLRIVFFHQGHRLVGTSGGPQGPRGLLIDPKRLGGGTCFGGQRGEAVASPQRQRGPIGRTVGVGGETEGEFEVVAAGVAVGESIEKKFLRLDAEAKRGVEPGDFQTCL